MTRWQRLRDYVRTFAAALSLTISTAAGRRIDRRRYGK